MPDPEETPSAKRAKAAGGGAKRASPATTKKSPAAKATKVTPAAKAAAEKAAALPKPPVKTEEELKFSVIAEGGAWGGAFGAADNRSAPPNKGDKAAPRGPANCLEGVTIVISGVLDSLERHEAEAGGGYTHCY